MQESTISYIVTGLLFMINDVLIWSSYLSFTSLLCTYIFAYSTICPQMLHKYHKVDDSKDR